MNYKNIIKKQSFIIGITIFIMSIILIGTSYAIFQKVTKGSSEQVIETGDFTIYFGPVPVDAVSITHPMVPVTDYIAMQMPYTFYNRDGELVTDYDYNNKYDFKIKNNGSLPAKYKLTLNVPADETNPIPLQYKKLEHEKNADGLFLYEDKEGHIGIIGGVGRFVYEDEEGTVFGDAEDTRPKYKEVIKPTIKYQLDDGPVQALKDCETTTLTITNNSGSTPTTETINGAMVIADGLTLSPKATTGSEVIHSIRVWLDEDTPEIINDDVLGNVNLIGKKIHLDLRISSDVDEEAADAATTPATP